MARLSALLLALLFTSASLAKSKELILGEKAYSRGAYDAAREHFERAIENGDESGDPRLYIGLMLEARRLYAESIPYFRAAAERPMQRKFKKVAFWKLVILYRQGRQYPDALKYVERLEDMGEKSELFEKIRDEAEHNPAMSGAKGYPEIKKGNALEKKLGEKGVDQNETMRAIIAAFKQAISEDARWKDYRWKIARYQEKLKESAEAKETYQKIWQEDEDPGAAYKLGLFTRKSGDFRTAIEYFDAALAKGIEDPQLKYYVRVNAAQSRYGMGHFKDAHKHAKGARDLTDDIELKKKSLLTLKRVFCLSHASQGEIDDEYCKFSKKEEHPTFLNLYAMKHAMAEKQTELAATHATKIYETEATESDDSGKALPAYAMADLPVAIGVLFAAEKYRAVLLMTDRFQKILSVSPEYHGWRAVSHFALKEYGSALAEFDKIKTLSPSQMNLHLIAMAQMGDFAGIRAKGTLYMKNAKAREKLVKNFRKMKIYEPLRREAWFEDWLAGK